MDLKEFLEESNWIEGISSPYGPEYDAAEKFLRLERIKVADLVELVANTEPGAELRDKPGMDVRVGNYRPPPGGPIIVEILGVYLKNLNGSPSSPYALHCEYERLHPFDDCNGRSGRLLWLWQMGGIEKAPLGFLHHFYLQALSEGCGRG